MTKQLRSFDRAPRSRLQALARRWELVPGRQRPPRAWQGLVLIALVCLGLYTLMTLSVPLIGGGRGTEVTAVFGDAAGARKGTTVRVGGVDVGTVTGVEPHAGGRGVDVVLRIERGGVQLRADARAVVRWRTLLGGNVYIDLDPGSARRPLSGPIERTQTQVELADLLRPLAGDGTQGLRNMIGGFAEGLSDRAAVGGALERLAPTMRPLAGAAAALRGSRRGDLARVVDGAGRTFAGLSRDDAALAGLAEHGAATFATTAAHAADIDALLRVAPGALAETRTAMVALRPTLATLERLSSRLRPGARRLASASAGARRFFTELAPVLRDTAPLLPDLRAGLQTLAATAAPGRTVLRDLTGTLDRVHERLVPYLRRVDPDTRLRLYEAIGPVFSGLASAGEQFDANGHALSFAVAPNDSSIATSFCRLFLSDPSERQKLRCDALTAGLEAVLRGRRKGGR